MLVDGLTVILWKWVAGPAAGLYELVPGFFASFAAIVLVSLLGARGPRALPTAD